MMKGNGQASQAVDEKAKLKFQQEEKEALKIQNTLKNYQKISINVKMYCELCASAAKLNQDRLLQAYKEYQPTENRRQENSNKLAIFLLKPNINYSIAERVEQKKAEAMIDAGKRIVGQIAYAWDYYFRLLKGKAELVQNKPKQNKTNKDASLYDDKNISMALKRIQDMLSEMEANKYHWENYTKEGLANLQQEKKEIEEEETFIKLLQNMLQAQIEKIKQRRRTSSLEQSQRQISPRERTLDFGPLQHSSYQQKHMREIIKPKDYFRQKLSQTNPKLQSSDPIAHSQQQRKFNAMALKYYITTKEQ